MTNIKVKLSDLYFGIQAFQKIASKELPFKISYRLMKLMRKINPHLEDLEKMRLKLIDTHGKEIDGGGGKQVPPENMQQFMKEFNELLAEELSVDDVHLLNADDLENITLSLNELDRIKWLFGDFEGDNKETTNDQKLS